MAFGDMITFNELAKDAGNKLHDFDTDTYKVALITTLPVATQASPALSDYTEVTAGGGYTAGGITLAGVTFTTTGAETTFDSSTNPAWTKAAGSPTDIVAALVYNTVTGAAVCAVDLTTDGGTTPVSLVDSNITITWNASGIVKFTRT